MQQMAFRDKNSRRGKISRRLTSRKPTFNIIEQIKIFILKIKSQSESDHFVFLLCYNKGTKDESSFYIYINLNYLLSYRFLFVFTVRRNNTELLLLLLLRRKS